MGIDDGNVLKTNRIIIVTRSNLCHGLGIIEDQLRLKYFFPTAILAFVLVISGFTNVLDIFLKTVFLDQVLPN